MITNQKPGFSLRYFNTQLGLGKKYAPLDILNINMCYFEVQEVIVFKTPKRHKKSAAEGGRLLRLFLFVFCTIISWTSIITNIDTEYI